MRLDLIWSRTGAGCLCAVVFEPSPGFVAAADPLEAFIPFAFCEEFFFL